VAKLADTGHASCRLSAARRRRGQGLAATSISPARRNSSDFSSSMMRTTAFPAVTASLMQCRGEVARRGAAPQERVLDPDRYLDCLAGAGITVSGLSAS
jgi:hypothetical protein